MNNPAPLRIVKVEPHVRFEELLVKNLDVLYNVAVRLTRSNEEAEDLVQETCLKAFRAFGQLENQASAKSWFLSILYNIFRNIYKKHRQAPFVDIELTEDLLASAATLPYNLETVFAGLLEDEVEQALMELPEEFRSAIILSDLEDCSYREIAEILGCSMGTVASRLFRGRQILRESLENYAKRHGLL